MPTVTASSVKTGDNVRVTLIDNLQHTVNGSVIAIATYDVAKSMQTDLAARHAAIQAYVSGLPYGDPLPEVTEEKFLIINTGSVRPTVVAFDWIEQIELVERGATYRIKLLNSSKADADKAVAILRANNISCQIDVLY